MGRGGLVLGCGSTAFRRDTMELQKVERRVVCISFWLGSRFLVVESMILQRPCNYSYKKS